MDEPAPSHDPLDSYDDAIIGRRVNVYWAPEATWYRGQIMDWFFATEEHLVRYDDGDQRHENLNDPDLVWVFDDEALPVGDTLRLSWYDARSACRTSARRDRRMRRWPRRRAASSSSCPPSPLPATRASHSTPHIKMVAPSIRRPFTSLVLGLQASATRRRRSRRRSCMRSTARGRASMRMSLLCIGCHYTSGHLRPPRHHRALNLKRHHPPDLCCRRLAASSSLSQLDAPRRATRASLSQAHATRSIITRRASPIILVCMRRHWRARSRMHAILRVRASIRMVRFPPICGLVALPPAVRRMWSPPHTEEGQGHHHPLPLH